MALAEVRYQFRVSLFDGDRGIDVATTVLASRHPSETTERLHLRVLAWALYYSPGLAFGPGLCDPHAPTLVERDLTGQVALWIDVNPPDPARVAHTVRHHRGARVVGIFGGAARRDRFVATAHATGQRGLERAELAAIDGELVAALGELDAPRTTWSITLVADHLYLDADGATFDGAVERSLGLPARALERASG
jgi:uncharacterized protein YaeQ